MSATLRSGDATSERAAERDQRHRSGDATSERAAERDQRHRGDATSERAAQRDQRATHWQSSGTAWTRVKELARRGLHAPAWGTDVGVGRLAEAARVHEHAPGPGWFSHAACR